MSLTFKAITFDCADALAVGQFWSAVLDRPLDTTPMPPSSFFASIGIGDLTRNGLMFIHVPLPQGPGSFALLATLFPGGITGEHDAHGWQADFNLHLLGMWFNFALSAVLIAWFVARMAQSLRERDQRLAVAREAALRNEQLVALGTLAAGAAHELGTPLSTIAVIATELERDRGHDSALVEDLRLLRA